MKLALWLLILGVGLGTGSNGQAGEVVPKATRALGCEMVDVNSGRVFDQKIVPLSMTSRQPILLLLGAGSVMGTVRDFPAATLGEHRLELVVTRDQGFDSGRGTAYATYQVNQKLSREPLAQVSIFGDWTYEIQLECFLVQARP